MLTDIRFLKKIEGIKHASIQNQKINIERATVNAINRYKNTQPDMFGYINKTAQ